MKNLERWYYPKSIPEALELLAEGGGKVKVIGGGTALAESRSPDIVALVDITRIDALQHATVEGDGRCTLGAVLTAHHLAEWLNAPPVVARTLCKAAGTISHRMHRNVITLGGNIVQLYAWSDLPVALLALDAVCVLQSAKNGTRRLPIRKLTTVHPAKELLFHEMLTQVEIPALPARSGGTFVKFARTETDYAFATVAARVDLDGDGVVSDCRIVVGCAVPRPVRLEALEAMVTGQDPSPGLAAEVGSRVGTHIRPLGDFRASAAYRAELCSVLVKRALLECFDQVVGVAAIERGEGA